MNFYSSLQRTSLQKPDQNYTSTKIEQFLSARNVQQQSFNQNETYIQKRSNSQQSLLMQSQYKLQSPKLNLDNIDESLSTLNCVSPIQKPPSDRLNRNQYNQYLDNLLQTYKHKYQQIKLDSSSGTEESTYSQDINHKEVYTLKNIVNLISPSFQNGLKNQEQQTIIGRFDTYQPCVQNDNENPKVISHNQRHDTEDNNNQQKNSLVAKAIDFMKYKNIINNNNVKANVGSFNQQVKMINQQISPRNILSINEKKMDSNHNKKHLYAKINNNNNKIQQNTSKIHEKKQQKLLMPHEIKKYSVPDLNDRNQLFKKQQNSINRSISRTNNNNNSNKLNSSKNYKQHKNSVKDSKRKKQQHQASADLTTLCNHKQTNYIKSENDEQFQRSGINTSRDNLIWDNIIVMNGNLKENINKKQFKATQQCTQQQNSFKKTQNYFENLKTEKMQNDEKQNNVYLLGDCKKQILSRHYSLGNNNANNNQSKKMDNLFKKTENIFSNFKKREKNWLNEKQLLLQRIEELKNQLHEYEAIKKIILKNTSNIL